jgi:hypothetical protein
LCGSPWGKYSISTSARFDRPPSTPPAKRNQALRVVPGAAERRLDLYLNAFAGRTTITS